MKRFLLGVCSVLGILSLLVGVCYYSEQIGFFNIKKIELTINKNSIKESNTSIDRYLSPFISEEKNKLEKIKGQSIWKVNVKELSVKMLNKGWIENVEVRRDWPNRLEVVIQPKEIGALLVQGSGEIVPIGVNGDLFAATPLSKSPDLPIVRGKIFEQKKDLRIQVIKLIKSLPDHGSFSKKQISEIGYDDKEGFWLNVLPSKITIKMGFDSDLAREERISQVLDYLDRNNIQARVIDANFAKKVLVKLRKDP